MGYPDPRLNADMINGSVVMVGIVARARTNPGRKDTRTRDGADIDVIV